jgi:hypothetical protein
MKALVLLALVAGCSTEIPKCVPGSQQECGCSGGAMGAQSCAANGTFGTCVCSIPDAALPATCAAQTDCPAGYACGLASATDTAPSCYRVTYDTGRGGFGTSCALESCSGSASPCATGFTCNGATKCDQTATCTHACTGDTDCPPTMFCDASQTCRAREECSPCAVDDQCGPSARCATDATGAKFCGTTCASDSDCPLPSSDLTGSATASRFEHCTGGVCRPTSGACHGDGSLCTWCRTGMTDCGSNRCFDDAETTEHWCTQDCTVTLTFVSPSYVPSNDTCPSGFRCFYGFPNCSAQSCSQPGVCAKSYQFLSCYP